jgi:alpha-D-xyloside xylohydrolase
MLHEANLHAMISIWPVFGKGTPNYDALDKMGGLTRYYLGQCSYPHL